MLLSCMKMKKLRYISRKYKEDKVAKKAYTKAELKKFEKNILEKIDEVNQSIEGVRSTTRPTNSVFLQERSEDFNEGTEAHEVEKTFLLMSRESDYLINLKKALQRIKDGTYGVCEISLKSPDKCESSDCPLISKERLMEVPNATKGVFCKEKKKLNLI
jgi:DnaK suppressor protein